MAHIFEFLSKDGNITPEKARKSRQMQFHDKTAYRSLLSMRSLAIDEPGSSVRALYATLHSGLEGFLESIVVCLKYSIIASMRLRFS